MALCPKTTWRIPKGYVDRDLRTTYGIVHSSNIDLGLMGSKVGKYNIHTHGGYRNITANKNASSVTLGFFSSLTNFYPVADNMCNYTQALIFPAMNYLCSVNTQASLAFPKRAMYPAYIDFDTFKYREQLMGYKQVTKSVGKPLSYLFKGLLVDTSASLFQKRIYRNDKLYLDTNSYQFKDVETNQVVRSSAPDLNIFRPFNDGAYSGLSIRNHRRELNNFKYYGTYYQLKQYTFDETLYEAHRQELEEKLMKDTTIDVLSVSKLFKFEYSSNDIRYKKLFLSLVLPNYDWNDDLVIDFIDGKYQIDFDNNQLVAIDTNKVYLDRYWGNNTIYSFRDTNEIDFSIYLKYIITAIDLEEIRDILRALENNTPLEDTQTDFYYFNFAGIDRVGKYLSSFYKIDGWYDLNLQHYWNKDTPSTYPSGVMTKGYNQTQLNNMFSYPGYIPPRNTDELSSGFYNELDKNPSRFQRVISEELFDFKTGLLFSTSMDKVHIWQGENNYTQQIAQGDNLYSSVKTPLGSINVFTPNMVSFTPYNLIRYAKTRYFTGDNHYSPNNLYYRSLEGASDAYTEHNIPSYGFFNCDIALDYKYEYYSINYNDSNFDYEVIRVWCESMNFYTIDSLWLPTNYKGISGESNIRKYTATLFNKNVNGEFVDSLTEEGYKDTIDIQKVAHSISPYHCNIENLKLDNTTDNYEVYQYFHNLGESKDNIVSFQHLVYIKGLTNSFKVNYRTTGIQYTKEFLADDANEEDYQDVFTDVNGRRYIIKDNLTNLGEYTEPKEDASVDITSQVLFNFQEKQIEIKHLDILLDEFINNHSNGEYIVAEYEDKFDGKTKYKLIKEKADRWYRNSDILDRCTPYLWVHNTYHTVQAFRFNTIDPFTFWFSWLFPKWGPRLNLLGQPNADRRMLGGYYNSYDRASNLYLQKCYQIHTKQWDKLKNPNYVDTAYKVDNTKGKVLKKFTNQKLINYQKPLLEDITYKADGNEADYKSYTNSIKTQFGTCITTRFDFTIYFNAKIRATKLLARMGWMYLNYIYTKCSPDSVDENGNYSTSIYAPDRVQFSEKRIALKFRKVIYEKEKEGNKASYYCEMNKANTELTFYCRTKQIKYILQINSFCPRFNQDYKKYDLNKSIQVDNRIPSRHLEPLTYTHRIVKPTNPPKTKYKLSNRSIYEYKVNSVFYNTPMKVKYVAQDDTNQEVEFTPVADNNFVCFYKPYADITNTDETYKDYDNTKDSRDIRTYLRDRVFIRYSNSMLEDTYFKLFNKSISIRFSEISPFDLDGNINKLYINNNTTYEIEDTLNLANYYHKQINLFHLPKKEYFDNEGIKHSVFDRSAVSWLAYSHLEQSYKAKNTISGVFYKDNLVVIPPKDDLDGNPTIPPFGGDKEDIPILESNQDSNIYNRHICIDEIIDYIIGVLPNNYVLLVSEFEQLFVNPSPDFVLCKIFSEEQLYRLGQYCYLVTNNIELIQLDDGVNISYYRLRLINQQVIKQLFDMKSNSPTIMAYPFLPMPIDLFKKLPIYCKLFVKNMNSYLENLCFVVYPTRDATSARWVLGWSILDIINILVISILITIFTFGAGTPIAIVLICLAVAIAILQITMLLVDTKTAKTLGIIVKVLQVVSSIVSIGGGFANVGSISSTSLTTLQTANIALSSVNTALSIINTSLDMVFKSKQNEKIKEYNKALEKYNNKVEEYVNFIESTEFSGMYAINTTEYDIIEKQIDKYDTLDTIYDDNTSTTLEALYTQLDTFYDGGIR